MSTAGDELRAAATNLESMSQQPWKSNLYDHMWSTTALMRSAASEIDRVVSIPLLGITINL